MLTGSSKPISIIANWKMNPVSFIEADNLILTMKKGLKKIENIDVIICPPSIFIPKIKKNKSFDLGIQNVFWEDQGAFTGEISSKIARNFGVNYAIIGHSERRLYLRETDEMVNLKIRSAIKNNLNPILCIGETLKEKQQDKTSEIITRQLEKALKDISKSKIQSRGLGTKFLIAYEPIWAIGTGITPTTDEIMSMKLFIKKIISKLYDRPTAEKISILYGGSVNSQNALDFVDKTGMDGLLIGGASLNGSEFVRIVGLFG